MCAILIYSYSPFVFQWLFLFVEGSSTILDAKIIISPGEVLERSSLHLDQVFGAATRVLLRVEDKQEQEVDMV